MHGWCALAQAQNLQRACAPLQRQHIEEMREPHAAIIIHHYYFIIIITTENTRMHEYIYLKTTKLYILLLHTGVNNVYQATLLFL